MDQKLKHNIVYRDRECIQVDFEGNLQPYLAYSIPRIRVADEDLIMEQSVYDNMIRKRDDFYRGNDNTQDNIKSKILEYCNVARSKKEIVQYFGYKDVKSFAKRYINPLCEAGQLQMTIPEHPTSRNQKYITIK